MIPKISVIIPCYNYGKFIQETVNSVLAQTFKDYEIIIVDDGSTDDYTLDILKKIQQVHPEIKIIYQPNGHLSNARNTGIRSSSGEFFLPLDSDDVIEPEMLEKCYSEMLNNPKLGFVYTYVHFFGDFDLIWRNQGYNFYDLLFHNHPTVCALVRKKAWEDAGGYDEKMKSGYEDWEFWINIGKRRWFGKVFKKPLFKYRKHGKSMLDDARAKHNENIEFIRNKHRELYTKKSLNKIKSHWKPLWKIPFEKISREISTVNLKMEMAGILNTKEWKKHPFRTAGRCIPVRIKNIINKIFGKEILDTKYFNNKF